MDNLHIYLFNRFYLMFIFLRLSYKDDRFTDPLSMVTARNCIIMSTGVLLLADTIPSLTVNLMAPFFPFYIKCVYIISINKS